MCHKVWFPFDEDSAYSQVFEGCVQTLSDASMSWAEGTGCAVLCSGVGWGLGFPSKCKMNCYVFGLSYGWIVRSFLHRNKLWLQTPVKGDSRDSLCFLGLVPPFRQTFRLFIVIKNYISFVNPLYDLWALDSSAVVLWQVLADPFY